jgi:predicted AlkP superfamily pyrophosphatase or phosphodiesterase
VHRSAVATSRLAVFGPRRAAPRGGFAEPSRQPGTSGGKVRLHAQPNLGSGATFPGGLRSSRRIDDVSPKPYSRRPAIALTAVVAAGALLSCTGPEPAPPEGTPRLILFIVADQVRADYLERFRPLLSGGLARLLDEGVVFTDAHHFHAATVTATGHATLATGRLPRNHGIVGNGWYDRALGRSVTSVTDLEHGRSPHYLLVPTLGDLLHRTYPRALVYGIGGKDRSAILTVGREADAAFWYDGDEGTFVTSSYYLGAAPEWLDRFNEAGLLDRHFGETWTPLHSLEELAPYDVEQVDWGYRDRQFPHPLGGPSAYPDDDFYGDVGGTPFLDEHVVALAEALIEGEGLGADAVPDFLGVTLPAVDAVGHTFGPNSPELVDAVVRLDRSLGALLDFVDERIGLDRVVVSLSSDHGVGPIPELLQRRGDEQALRLDDETALCFQSVGEALTARFGNERWIEAGLYFDRPLLAEHGIDRAELADAVRSILETCRGIARVHFGDELEARGAGELDDVARLFYNSYHSERSGDLVVQLEPNALATWSAMASHGSPYLYDTHVPWLLRLPDGGGARVIGERVHTIDVVPTLLALTGLDLGAAELDGVDRSSLAAP